MALVIEQAIRSPSFEELGEVLDLTAAPIGPAESHGLLCGMLCACPQLDTEKWLARVLDGVDSQNASAKACCTALKRLELATVHQLMSDDFTFQLLVPRDSESLGMRSHSLGDWCVGFLAGVGLGGVQTERLSPDSREILLDIAEIARVERAPDAEDEGNETAYAELVEYLRVGTLILREELQFAPHAQTSDRDGC